MKFKELGSGEKFIIKVKDDYPKNVDCRVFMKLSSPVKLADLLDGPNFTAVYVDDGGLIGFKDEDEVTRVKI